MLWLSFLRRYGPLLILLALGLGLLVAANSLVTIGERVGSLEYQNRALIAQNEILRQNRATALQLRAEVMVCLDQVEAIRLEGDAWQARYDVLRRRRPEIQTVIERIPVDVASTDCGEAVVQAAAFLEDAIRPLLEVDHEKPTP